ncbi:MAG: threonylcarbamoyl-AMP synthase, partial [Candidatus Omnitrophica bacterium]|nr:threonylcarbamoyl-AMP synthase [Candidatus Omnitrophota bacterium]
MRSLRKTLVLKITPENPAKGKIILGAKVLRGGGLVAFPTETVYGLVANLLDAEAVERLYRVKKRPKNKPFTVHVSDLAMIEKMGCTITRQARAFIDRFWPGPLTIVLKSWGNKKIGFRMPDNRIALELIRRAGVPVIAPSA